MFVELLPERVFASEHILVPHFLLVTILFMTMYAGRKQGIIYGAIFGLLFDVVYTGVIGIYLFMYPLIAYVVAKIMRILQLNILSVTIVSVLGVAILELGVYELNYFIKVTSMDFTSFTSLRLLPTLLLNFAFSILFAYPFKRLFEKHGEELKSE